MCRWEKLRAQLVHSRLGLTTLANEDAAPKNPDF
jgi:hypothetical protein